MSILTEMVEKLTTENARLRGVLKYTSDRLESIADYSNEPGHGLMLTLLGEHIDEALNATPESTT